MATNSKPTRIELVTPKVPFKYPRITEPDYGNDKYPKPDGEYSLMVELPKDSPAAQQLIDTLQPLYDTAIEAAQEKFSKLKPAAKDRLGQVTANPFYKDVYDEDDNPTGNIEFKFKRTASGTNKKGKNWNFILPLVDASLSPLAAGTDVWGGSQGCISFSVAEGGYFIDGTAAAGISLKLEGVQVLELVNGSARSGAALGFSAQDGYTVPADDDLPTDSDSDVADDNEDDDDTDF